MAEDSPILVLSEDTILSAADRSASAPKPPASASPSRLIRAQRASKERFRRVSKEVMNMVRRPSEEATFTHSPSGIDLPPPRNAHAPLEHMFDELIRDHSKCQLSTSKSEDLREWTPRKPPPELSERAAAVNSAVRLAKAEAIATQEALAEAAAEAAQPEKGRSRSTSMLDRSVSSARSSSTRKVAVGRKVGGGEASRTAEPMSCGCNCVVS